MRGDTRECQCETKGAEGPFGESKSPRPAEIAAETIQGRYKQINGLELAHFEPRRGDNADGSSQWPTSVASMKAEEEEEIGQQEPLFVVRLAEVVPGLGIMFALATSMSLGTAAMLVKLTTSLHSVQVAMLRSTIQATVYLAIIKFRRLGLRPAPDELWPVVFRAVLTGFSISVSHYALTLISLADFTTIRFTLPIWTMIVSYFCLGESCSLLKIFAMVISLTGAFLIAKPREFLYVFDMLLCSLGLQSEHEFLSNSRLFHQASAPNATQNATEILLAAGAAAAANSTLVQDLNRLPVGRDSLRQLTGCLMGLISSVFLAMSITSLRLCRKTPAEIIIVWLSVWTMVATSTFLTLTNSWRLPGSLKDCAYVLANGTCGAIGQWFITNALKVEQSSVIALARTTEIVIAFSYSALLLGEPIRASSIIGSVLVATGVLLVIVPTLMKRKAGQKEGQQQQQEAIEGSIKTQSTSVATINEQNFTQFGLEEEKKQKQIQKNLGPA